MRCNVERAEQSPAEKGRLFVLRHVGAGLEPYQRLAARGLERLDVIRDQGGGA